MTMIENVTPILRVESLEASRRCYIDKLGFSLDWDAGGMIMIHGMPNQLKRARDYYLTHDWTDGCIAVSNADMTEIWMLTPDDVPIDILP